MRLLPFFFLLRPAAARRKHPHYYKTRIVNGTKRDCLCGACNNASFAHYRLADTFKGDAEMQTKFESLSRFMDSKEIPWDLQGG